MSDFDTDADWNWISDFIDGLISLWNAKFDPDEVVTFLEDNITKIKDDINGNWLDYDDKDDSTVWERIQQQVDKWGQDVLAIWDDTAEIELDLSDVTSEISDGIDQTIAWLGCWFGGNCMSLPLNRAPLAPWNDPTWFLWEPLWDGLHTFEWIPVFAYPTVWPVIISWVPTPPYRPTNYVWAWWILDLLLLCLGSL